MATRVFGLAAVVAVGASLTVLTPVPAAADKSGTCAFELSAPRLMTIPGGPTVVTTTLRPTHCTGDAQPASTTVCLSPDGGAGQCATKLGPDGAEVFFAPTDSATGYTATGTGSIWIGNHMGSVTAGPIHATP